VAQDKDNDQVTAQARKVCLSGITVSTAASHAAQHASPHRHTGAHTSYHVPALAAEARHDPVELVALQQQQRLL
jgi:hypothetical protein